MTLTATKPALLDLIESLVSIPTAPFHEHWVMERLDKEIAQIEGVECAIDAFGNRIVRLRRGNPGHPPAVFVAHLDHPGFTFAGGCAVATPGTRRYEARFEGRVFDAFFPGAPVRFYRSADDEGVSGRVVLAETEGADTGYRRAVLEADGDANGAVLAMWDVPAFRLVDGIVHSRACDDLVGCAAILAALHQLAADNEPIDVAAIFSRAEEAGFCGVLCLLGEPSLHPLLPRDGAYISVENSSEYPGVTLGQGAIIRLGDRASTFDSRMTDSLWTAARANGLSARRVLMDKGTCEATPFAKAGLRAGGICVPLRNYHNMNQATTKIEPEAIALSDAEELVALIRDFSRSECRGAKPQDAVGHNYTLYLNRGRAELSR
jgi:endoglucanase